MSDASIKLEIVGTLDPDATLFVLCMERAAQFKSDSFTEYASRVETLIEIHKNTNCQRVTHEAVE